MSLSLPLDYFLRTTLVFGLAYLVTRMVRRQPAAFRHVIWMCAFSIAALTPVLSHFGPRFQFESEAPPSIAPQAAVVVGPTIELVLPPAPPPSKHIPYFEILWIAGILPFVVRAWNAARNAHALLKNATILYLPQALSGRIAESDAIATPMTLGVFRPWILLPAEHRIWTGDRLRAVLLHELAHVRRRDCLVQWLPNILCAVNWFNPLAWLARSEMLCESERACDDAVIRSGITGNAFAQDLVDIARSIQKGNSLMSIALTTKLERRIQRLIDPSTDRAALSLGRTIVGAVLALVLLAPVAGVRADQVVRVPAVSAAPQVTPEPASGPEPVLAPAPAPRKTLPIVAQAAQQEPLTPSTPLTPLTTLAQATPTPQPAPSSQPSSTGSISGVVSDPTGAVVPNAIVQIHTTPELLFSWNGGVPIAPGALQVHQRTSDVLIYRTMTGPVGEWSFDGLAAGKYTIEIQSPGFTAFSTGLTVNPGLNNPVVSHLSLGRISQSLTITAQASNTSAAPQARAQSSSKPIRVGGNVQAAKLIHRVDPVFPQSARDRGVQGPVTIQAIIGKDGFIKDTFQTVSDAPADLAQAAIDAIRLWQFEPSRLNGEPVEVMTEITVNFQLQ